MSAICGHPSKQAAAGEEAAAGQVSGLSAPLSYFEHCPLSYVDLGVQVSPQTRQIARKISVDFCHVVLLVLKRGWAKKGPENSFNSASFKGFAHQSCFLYGKTLKSCTVTPLNSAGQFAAFSANFLQATICIFRAKVSYSLHCGVVHTRGLPKISIREKSLTIRSARAAALLHSRTLFLRPQTFCCNLLL